MNFSYSCLNLIQQATLEKKNLATNIMKKGDESLYRKL